MKKNQLFLVVGAILIVVAFLFVQFLNYHENKVNESGWLYHERFVDFLPVINFSVAIFSITYGSLLLYFFHSKKSISFITKLMLSYTLLLIFRMITMSLVPLKEPELIIYLQDPFLNNIIYPGEIDTDLFFSGHTALIMILFFLSKKWVFVVLAIVIGGLLIVQRVHYSIDVLAAFPFAYVIVLFAEYLLKRVKLKE